jgi:hypothetical protein
LNSTDDNQILLWVLPAQTNQEIVKNPIHQFPNITEKHCNTKNQQNTKPEGYGFTNNTILARNNVDRCSLMLGIHNLSLPTLNVR